MTSMHPDLARAGTPVARIARFAARTACAVVLLANVAPAAAAPWSLLSPADGSIVTIAGHPKREGHYYANTATRAVDGSAIQPWVTLDGAAKWRRAVPLDVEPSTRAAGTILAGGIPTRLYLEAGDRLLRSDDEGTTWIALDLGAPSTPPPRLLGVNPLDGTEVIVLAGGLPQRSVDAGAVWAPLTGFAAETGSVDWFARIVHLVSATQTRSYALDGTPIGSANFAPRKIAAEGNLALAIRPGSLYRTIDNGVVWTLTLSDAGQVEFGGIAYAPSISGFAYVWEKEGAGRLWRTPNRGDSWVQVANAPCDCDWTGIAVSVTDANVLFASTTAGVYASQDGGLTFTALPQASGLPGAPVRNVLSDAGEKARKWLVIDAGRLPPLVSGNQGATWSAVSPAPNGDIPRPSFLHPDVGGLLFGAGSPHAGGTTLWRSDDNGDTWKSVLVFGDGTDEALVDIVPGPVPFELLAFVRLSSDVGAIAKVFRSTNQGLDWTPRPAPPPLEPYAAMRTSAGLLFAGRPALKSTQPTLLRSTDEGLTWQSIELAPGSVIPVTSLGRARSVSSRIYAGTNLGGADAVWRSDDGGLTWDRASRALGSAAVTSIAVHPTLPDQVVIAQGLDGVFRSIDGGATWTPMDAGLLDRDIQGVSYDASESRYVYASGAGGAYRADLAVAAPLGVERAVEYFYPPFGHYFVTAIPGEIDVLDRGVIPGWERTGQRPPVETPDGLQTLPVCRFFAVGFAPKSSHFYTPYPVECELLKTNPIWLYEGIAFGWRLPDGLGRCDLGQRPLYRFYNDAESGAPNHRYTTSLRVADQMRSEGWIPEGDGRTQAFACVPL